MHARNDSHTRAQTQQKEGGGGGGVSRGSHSFHANAVTCFTTPECRPSCLTMSKLYSGSGRDRARGETSVFVCEWGGGGGGGGRGAMRCSRGYTDTKPKKNKKYTDTKSIKIKINFLV